MSGIHVDETEYSRRSTGYIHEATGGVQCGNGSQVMAMGRMTNAEFREAVKASRQRGNGASKVLRTGEVTAG